MSSSYTKTRIMVECALMIALGTILANIKICLLYTSPSPRDRG